MKIYGVALLAFCFLFGKLLGNYLGVLIGLKSDVGGVGFAMLLLMISYTYFKKKGVVKELTTQGILFCLLLQHRLAVSQGECEALELH